MHAAKRIVRGAALSAGICVFAGSCIPAAGGGGGQGGFLAPPGGSQAYDPIATAQEIDDYLYNGSATIEWFDEWDQFYGVSCAYFATGGGYESITWWGEPDRSYYYDSYTEAQGSWWVNGSQLCLGVDWYDYHQGWPPQSGCFVAEWSADSSMLLISPTSRQVVAELITYDGVQPYQEGCGLW